MNIVDEIYFDPADPLTHVCVCICHGLIRHDYGHDHKCCEVCPTCDRKIKVEAYDLHVERCKPLVKQNPERK